MSANPNYNRDGSSGAFRVATGAAYDILAADPTGNKKPCRWIDVMAPAAVVVTGLDGTDVTLPAAPTGVPWRWYVQAKAIVSGGSSDVVVHW